MDVLTSPKLVKALDVKSEKADVLDRYRQPGKKGDGGERPLDQFLVARRLVEAGARCVTLSFGGWDTHANNFKTMREKLPQLDHGVAALVQDLYDRGLDKDVSVIVWGEFGRTPTINKGAGRDHWPRVTCGVMAGGGMKTGQAIGATDRSAGEVVERPITFGEVFATLYHNLGIDAAGTTLPDLSGRPQYLVDGAKPIRELV
jgi:uncharacterized protein (DUF1501 family)